MTRSFQPRIGPDRRVRDRRAPRATPGAPTPARRPPRTALVAGALAALVVVAVAGAALGYWPGGPPGTPGAVAPRDRADALCRHLAAAPRWTPSLRVEPAVSAVRGRAAAAPAPGALAARVARALGVAPERVLRHWSERVGDFDVATLWVRLADGDRHALVVGWVENGELALCRFRFPGSGPALSAAEIAAGDDLLDRLLAPANFRVGRLPPGTRPGMGPLAALGPAS
jgi:hypothetical protein